MVDCELLVLVLLGCDSWLDVVVFGVVFLCELLVVVLAGLGSWCLEWWLGDGCWRLVGGCWLSVFVL